MCGILYSMNKKHVMALLFILAILLLGYLRFFWGGAQRSPLVPTVDTQTSVDTPQNTTSPLVYTNTTYGFTVTLPASWEGYSSTVVQKDTPQGSYFEIHLIHPQSTEQNPRMEVPILAIPIETWNTWYPPANPESGQHPFAAPVPATERARNTKYVFATAPRYNFSYLPGWEEVDEIVKTVTGL